MPVGEGDVVGRALAAVSGSRACTAGGRCYDYGAVDCCGACEACS